MWVCPHCIQYIIINIIIIIIIIIITIIVIILFRWGSFEPFRGEESIYTTRALELVQDIIVIIMKVIYIEATVLVAATLVVAVVVAVEIGVVALVILTR